MLFLGTEKYPVEDAYSQFLTSNGGYDNAYTSSENTNYYFSVNSDKLEEALDRFAQFFIGPLFNKDAVNREINAVNSEYEKDKGIPGWHVYLLMKKVADPDSEYSRYLHLSHVTLYCTDVYYIVPLVQSDGHALAIMSTSNMCLYCVIVSLFTFIHVHMSFLYNVLIVF